MSRRRNRGLSGGSRIGLAFTSAGRSNGIANRIGHRGGGVGR